MSSIISTFIPELIVGNDYNHYINNIFQTLPVIGLDKEKALSNSINQADDEGYWLEFGTHEGETIIYTAGCKLSNPKFKIYGFDSFEGLPEQWKTNPNDTKHTAGYFATDIPKVRDNVKLWVGWFDQQIPEYLKEYPNTPIAYLHIDGDLYSSAWTVLSELNHLIVTGTTILFDEFCPFGPYSKPYKFS